MFTLMQDCFLINYKNWGLRSNRDTSCIARQAPEAATAHHGQADTRG